MASVFEPNARGIADLSRTLITASARTVDKCWQVLRRAGQEYRRRVQRVIPREHGTAAQSMQVQEDRSGGTMAVAVGTSLKSDDGRPYPLYLEMGTARIAGGRVAAWKEGDAPVMDWPAKLADQPNFRITKDRRSRAYTMPSIGGARRRVYTMTAKGNYSMATRERAAGPEGSAKFERSVGIATRAFTAGQGEQMPFLRPVGYAMAPQVLGQLRDAVNEELRGGLDGKKF